MINKWNYSKIDALNYCLRRFYLRYKLKEPSIRLPAYVKGSLLHVLAENFWKKLGTEEEVEKDAKDKQKKAREKRQYFDAQSFAEYAQKQWKRIIIADLGVRDKVKELERKGFANRREEKKFERKKMDVIAWRDDKEKYVIQALLPEICKPWFAKFLEEGKPEFSELEFDFMLNGRRYNGRTDEIRLRNGKVVIRDFKSGNPWIDNIKLNYDPQLTFYNMGLCSLVIENPELARKLGIEGDVERLKKEMEQGILINEDFEEEFFMIEALPRIEKARIESERKAPKTSDFTREGDYDDAVKRRNILLSNIPEFAPRTKRTKVHFLELIEMIDNGERRLNSGEIPVAESGRKCTSCDMKIACVKRIETRDCDKKDDLKDSHGQAFFSFADVDFVDMKEGKKYQPVLKQKKLSFRKRKKSS